MQDNRKRYERLADVWNQSTSLKDAAKNAGIPFDDRNLRRIRRQAERELGIILHPHNPEKSTASQVECPSLLKVEDLRGCKDFIITSATNNSPTVKPFVEALKQFAKHRSAELLIIPVRYRNPSAVTKTTDYKWDESLYPYVLLDDLQVSSKLVISTTPLQATAVNPLSGMAPVSGIKSAIYGHPQMGMEVVATPANELPKIIHTTGSVSRPRYSSTKDGGKAKFNHSISAVYVQVVGTKFYPIQLMWDGKGFYYFDEYWTDEGMSEGHQAAGMVFGDDHLHWERKDVTAARVRVKALVQPKIEVRHDVLDFNSQNHHHTTIQKIKIAQEGNHLVKKEIDQAVSYLNKNAGEMTWIIRSNHHDAIEKWINRFDPDKDPHNAPFYFDIAAKVVESDKCAFELAVEDSLNIPYKFVSGNDKALIAGIDVSQHGDIGANGSRGSLKGFAKSSYKTVSGHTHTPGIEKGAWSVGCGTDRMTYKEGLSSWMLCDCLIYPNGKRALVFYINGKFRRDAESMKKAA